MVYLVTMTDIYQILSELAIPYTRYDHPAVFTVEESEQVCGDIPVAHTKNLFLRNRKGDKHFLVVVSITKRADLKKLEALLEEKVSFASPERLLKYLGVTPGSVTLLGLVNDVDREVSVIIDKELWENEILGMHPLINTATLGIKRTDLERFLAARGNHVRFVTL